MKANFLRCRSLRQSMINRSFGLKSKTRSRKETKKEWTLWQRQFNLYKQNMVNYNLLSYNGSFHLLPKAVCWSRALASTEDLIRPFEEIIKKIFLPNITGWNAFRSTGRETLAIPARFGGLGILIHPKSVQYITLYVRQFQHPWCL